MPAFNFAYNRETMIPTTQKLAPILHRLSEARRYKVLVFSRMLFLQECLVEQYHVEQKRGRKSYDAHWVRP